MNIEIRSWFTQGKIVEALCGLGTYFIPGVTYHDTHDHGFVVRELLYWAAEGHSEMAGQAFEDAVRQLLDTAMLDKALLLVHSYYVACFYHDRTLDIRENEIAEDIFRAIVKAKDILPGNEELRNRVLVVVEDIPALRNLLGLPNIPSPWSKDKWQ